MRSRGAGRNGWRPGRWTRPSVGSRRGKRWRRSRRCVPFPGGRRPTPAPGSRRSPSPRGWRAGRGGTASAWSGRGGTSRRSRAAACTSTSSAREGPIRRSWIGSAGSNAGSGWERMRPGAARRAVRGRGRATPGCAPCSALGSGGRRAIMPRSAWSGSPPAEWRGPRRCSSRFGARRRGCARRPPRSSRAIWSGRAGPSSARRRRRPPSWAPGARCASGNPCSTSDGSPWSAASSWRPSTATQRRCACCASAPNSTRPTPRSCGPCGGWRTGSVSEADGARSVGGRCYIEPMTTRPILTLIDGSSYVFRAYHALRTELSTSSGLPTRAVFGLTPLLLKSLREASPTHVAVVWDRDGRAFRSQIDPGYKAHRPETPDDLELQFPYIRKVVEALEVPSVEREATEADDVIATLARQAVEQGFDVVIVTGDKDFSQLVGPHVRLYDGMRDEWMGPAEVEAKWGVPPERFVEFQALLGDSSDNIPGVPGVGKKTAADLIA